MHRYAIWVEVCIDMHAICVRVSHSITYEYSLDFMICDHTKKLRKFFFLKKKTLSHDSFILFLIIHMKSNSQ